MVPATSGPEFQHYSVTIVPGILDIADIVGTSTWRASPTMGNASMDDTAVTFTSYDKTHIDAFSNLYRNLSHYRLTL
jgi:hypothetical protein